MLLHNGMALGYMYYWSKISFQWGEKNPGFLDCKIQFLFIYFLYFNLSEMEMALKIGDVPI